ncbi:MAG: hypothetical protein M1816_006663 [Peltula sp. TS41687]|nr:MAG: hypothetical protein M1816_006663 [Peltula sp. TS41687]
MRRAPTVGHHTLLFPVLVIVFIFVGAGVAASVPPFSSISSKPLVPARRPSPPPPPPPADPKQVSADAEGQKCVRSYKSKMGDSANPPAERTVNGGEAEIQAGFREHLWVCLEAIVATTGYDAKKLGDDVEAELQADVNRAYARCVIEGRTGAYVPYKGAKARRMSAKECRKSTGRGRFKPSKVMVLSTTGPGAASSLALGAGRDSTQGRGMRGGALASAWNRFLDGLGHVLNSIAHGNGNGNVNGNGNKLTVPGGGGGLTGPGPAVLGY